MKGKNQKNKKKCQNTKRKDYICKYEDCLCKKAKVEEIDVSVVDCDDCPIFEDYAIGDIW